MRLLVFIIIAFLVTISAYGSDTETVTLNTGNTIVLRDEVTEASISKLQLQLALNKSKRVYLYLYSPGGDISPGINLMNAIKAEIASGRKIICIADFAASMAFSIFQSCSERYITMGGIIMQHQPSIQLGGKLLSVKEQLLMIDQIVDIITESDSKRIGITKDEFLKRIMNDWWMVGEAAVNSKAADKVVLVKCTEKLIKTSYKETIQSMFGTFEVTWSACPVIHDPLSVSKEPAVGVSLKDFDKWVNSLNVPNEWKKKKKVIREVFRTRNEQ